jgi:hypothetical protein
MFRAEGIGSFPIARLMRWWILCATAGWSIAIASSPALGADGDLPSGTPTRADSPLALVAAVLPSSRAVQVGQTATAFATILATGSGTATGCSIAPINAPIGTVFSFQQTNNANVPIGAPNTPADIVGGGSQSFVFSLTPGSPFLATQLHFSFSCANGLSAPDTPGVNTFLLTSSSAPTPDVVALAASVGGIATVPESTGIGAFAVASINVGADAMITVTADTEPILLPLTLSLCQSNPITAACSNPTVPIPSVTLRINQGDTPTFSIFAQATGNIPFDPAVNRINVRFRTDAGGIVGSTSVAVQTR